MQQNNCRYILWTKEEIDALMASCAPKSVLDMYSAARYKVQRVDVARFMVLYAYGGLYADLDCFPNRDRYPQVSLGLCKMASRAMRQPAEWEIEVVVATRGNPELLRILASMKQAKKVWLGILTSHAATYTTRQGREQWQSISQKQGWRTALRFSL